MILLKDKGSLGFGKVGTFRGGVLQVTPAKYPHRYLLLCKIPENQDK